MEYISGTFDVVFIGCLTLATMHQGRLPEKMRMVLTWRLVASQKDASALAADYLLFMGYLM